VCSLFDRLLHPPLWSNDGTIVAISSMFHDYMAKCDDVGKFVSQNNNKRLTGMLGIFQALLVKRTQDFYAFKILRAIFQYVPPLSACICLPVLVYLSCRHGRF